jgi:O-antigen/teichoic acid export membrane protein
MVPKEIGTKIISNVDRYLLLYFLSPTAAGIYAVCFAVANILRNLTMVLNPTLYPTVTSAWDEGGVAMIRDLYYKIYKWYSLLAVPSLAGLTVLSGPILEILATAKVAASGQLVLPVLALGFFIRGYNNPLAYILNAAEQNKKLANATLIAAVVNLGLNLTLIQTVGIFGAVTATLVSYTLLTGYVFLEVRKKVAFPLPITSFLKAVIGTLVMSAVLVSLPFTLSPWECLVVYPIIGVSVYGSIIIKLEVITKRDLRYFVAQFVGE